MSLTLTKIRPGSEKNHWRNTFENCLKRRSEVDKLELLENFVSPDIYEIVCEAETYNEAMNLLNKAYT